MIPKIIHYCWISNDPYPIEISNCINSWAMLNPTYTKKKWGIDELMQIKNLPNFVKIALENKLYAFVSDYIRYYAVYNYGGIYCDSDILFIKPIPDNLLTYDFISTVEETKDYYGNNEKIIFKDNMCYGIGIEAAMFGGSKHNKICLEALRYYHTEYDNIFDSEKVNEKFFPLAPQVLGYAAHKYGFDYNNPVGKLLNNCYISKYLTLSSVKYNQYNYPQDTIALHMCVGSWRHKEINGVQS